MKTISGIEFASEHNGTDVFRVIELAYEQGQKDGHSEQLGTDLAEAGTNLISRAAAQTELQLSARRYTVAHEAHGEGRVVWSEDLISVSDAMDVLRKIPPAQPTFDARDTQYNLPIGTDCISRRQAIDALDEIEAEVANGYGYQYAKWREYFVEMPPAQPDLSEYSDKLWQKAYERGKAEAEIVRCKDCRFNTYSKKCLNPDSFFLVPADDFYCGYAERRTDEE